MTAHKLLYSARAVIALLALSAAASAQFTQAPGSPFQVGSGPQSVVVGDVNEDGKLDLIVADRSSNSVSVLLHKSTGGFLASNGSPFAVGTQPYSVAVGDFNADGKLDLAVANSGSSNVTILLGDGSGGFSPAASSPIAVGNHPLTQRPSHPHDRDPSIRMSTRT